MAWNEKIDIHVVLANANSKHDLSVLENDCPEDVKELLAQEVSKSVWLSRYAQDFRAAETIAAINRVLEKVFDEADRRRVWCGMPL